MKKTLLALATTAALALAPLPAHAAAEPVAKASAAPKKWKKCKYEDSRNCVWDARHMGNGRGTSFIVNKKGKITFITHKRAHRLAFPNR